MRNGMILCLIRGSFYIIVDTLRRFTRIHVSVVMSPSPRVNNSTDEAYPFHGPVHLTPAVRHPGVAAGLGPAALVILDFLRFVSILPSHE
jgi:hypothetical protein